jgi:hypothetical protein
MSPLYEQITWMVLRCLNLWTDKSPSPTLLWDATDTGTASFTRRSEDCFFLVLMECSRVLLELIFGNAMRHGDTMDYEPNWLNMLRARPARIVQITFTHFDNFLLLDFIDFRRPLRTDAGALRYQNVAN